MDDVTKELAKEISDLVNKIYQVELKDIIFEAPQDIKNGHLSTNVALKNCKLVKKNPFDFGTEIVNGLAENSKIAKVEVVKPGFINFYFSKQFFGTFVSEKLYNNFYKFPPKEEMINVEYVSANPTGDLHLGHARNAVFGDSLANLLKRVGYKVTKEYYINDAGVQMQNLGKSVQAFYLELCEVKFTFPENGYKGKEIKTIAQKIYEDFTNTKVETELQFFINFAYEQNLTEIKRILQCLNVEFDLFSSEQFYHDQGLVQEAITTLQAKDEIYEKDGAWWLNTTKYGDDKDRVLQKSDGTHTYLTSDIAYHKDKMERTNGLLINIWGGDHHGYVKRVEAAMQSLGFDKKNLEILLIQMVAILENNEKVKMSKRAGTSVTIKDLLKLISPDALRYFFVMRSPDTQLDFDIALANKQSSENPIFYIQYAHARICSLLEKSEVNLDKKVMIDSEQLTELDVKVINLLQKYEEVLMEAANNRRPHLISNYLYDIAANYHKYYNQEKILGQELAYMNNKLLISKLTKKIISDGLSIIGIKALEKM